MLTESGGGGYVVYWELKLHEVLEPTPQEKSSTLEKS